MSNIDKQALRKAAQQCSAQESLRIVEYHGKMFLRNSGGIVFTVLRDSSFPEYSSENENYARLAELSNPATVLALLDELEAKDSTIATQQQEIRTLLNALEQASEKGNSDVHGQRRLIGWRASDYTDETSDPELAKNWAAAIGVLPIFEGDVNTKLSTAAAGKGE